jgi:hypothetical protein
MRPVIFSLLTVSTLGCTPKWDTPVDDVDPDQEVTAIDGDDTGTTVDGDGDGAGDNGDPGDSGTDDVDADSGTDADSGEESPPKKALLVFIDGFIPEGIDTSETPTMDALMVDAAWSRTARAESTTISGSGWSSFLTGVHWDKHQVPDNAFSDPNFTDYPHIFSRLQEAHPDAQVGGCQSWEPIETGLVLPSDPDFSAFHDYYLYADDYWDDDSSDTLCAEEVASFAAEPDIDLLVMMFGELDGVAHESGYGAEYATYQAMLSKTDGEIGDILTAIEARPTYADEDWLVIVSTDHAGSPALGHGYNIPEHRLIPFIVSGPSVVAGEIWPAPQTVDIVPTALHHLGVELDGSWDMDGIVVGFESTAPPVAALDENLIFNGDAEYERGYEGYTSVPDAWIPGWFDSGYLTVVQYDSPDGYPTSSDSGPDDRGANFFAGGWTDSDTEAKWEIDLSPLASVIDSGASWTLSGWLGGYAAQEDRASVTVRFFDASGDLITSATIGPVSAAERGYATGLVERVSSGSIPAGVRMAVVTVNATWFGGYNDGYADNLALVISAD